MKANILTTVQLSRGIPKFSTSISLHSIFVSKTRTSKVRYCNTNAFYIREEKKATTLKEKNRKKNRK